VLIGKQRLDLGEHRFIAALIAVDAAGEVGVRSTQRLIGLAEIVVERMLHVRDLKHDEIAGLNLAPDRPGRRAKIGFEGRRRLRDHSNAIHDQQRG